MLNYGAIAYSVLTRCFGYSYGYLEPNEARRVATQNCHAIDAVLLCCESDCWIALAQSKANAAYGWGFASTPKNAISRAITECSLRANDPRLVICFSTSDGQQTTHSSEDFHPNTNSSAMNPKQLEKNLGLPNISASLVAYRDVAQKNKWYIRFSVPGSDGRYNPGVAVVSSSMVPKLINALNKAYKKMALLEEQQYTGKFSEDFVLRGEVSDSLAVTVSSKKTYFLFWSHKKIRLHFLVSSKTNTFSRSLD